eukprot:12774302-Ditylum_brightwellii.AAC.1
MGLCKSPNIFQEKISQMFAGLKEACVYIDNLLLITNGSWEHHLEKLDGVLDRFKCAGLKKKVEVVLKIAPPTTKKQLHSFIGMINYYCKMWQDDSEVLVPLAVLISKATPWKWTPVEQKAFEWAKKIFIHEMLLAYPDFNIPFEVHMDTSDTQLGAVISQCKMHVAFYLRKLNNMQKNYTVMEQELLEIVETLKEIKNILLCQQIR